ncbi:cytochrome P450 CYP72A219-like [Mangifera indica]|uniref:cytochrome P450 CYP72A219-like n=1 Tax=Mangifera indica TaxID=29780 RepID=UPI001CF94B03|nr:cytochrome P450 CYP72A219-like [Mangifera indica]
MELSLNSIAASIVLVTVVTLAWTVLNWVWLRPKKLERYLRQQGLSGKPYRLLYGDLKEASMMLETAKSRSFNVSDDITPRLVPFLRKTVKDYGKNSFIWVGPIPRVTIMNPEKIKDIFSRLDDFHKPQGNPLAKYLATGLAVYEGKKWAKHRRIIQPAFHLDKLKLMLPEFYQVCNEMISKWEKLVSAEGSCELDVWPYLVNLTADVISKTAFGSNFEDGRKIFELLTELCGITQEILQSVYIPGWRFLPTKRNRRLKEIDDEIRALLMCIIKNREKEMKRSEAVKNDLLGLLMESNYREIEEHGNNKNGGMTMDEVIKECKLFYFAGQETTSVLLVWTLVLLSEHQDWQARGREEVFQVFGDKKPSFDELNHLKVVTMILYEVLRLYPPATTIGRDVDEEIKIADLSLPAGVEVSTPVILVHRDQELWGDDAAEFKPERFAEGVSKATKSQASFVPFGWGPRICIGQNFALMEAKMALALILQNFAFELSPSYVHAPDTVITVHPEHGAHLILKKLQTETVS